MGGIDTEMLHQTKMLQLTKIYPFNVMLPFCLAAVSSILFLFNVSFFVYKPFFFCYLLIVIMVGYLNF